MSCRWTASVRSKINVLLCALINVISSVSKRNQMKCKIIKRFLIWCYVIYKVLWQFLPGYNGYQVKKLLWLEQFDSSFGWWNNHHNDMGIPIRSISKSVSCTKIANDGKWTAPNHCGTMTMTISYSSMVLCAPQRHNWKKKNVFFRSCVTRVGWCLRLYSRPSWMDWPYRCNRFNLYITESHLTNGWIQIGTHYVIKYTNNDNELFVNQVDCHFRF